MESEAERRRRGNRNAAIAAAVFIALMLAASFALWVPFFTVQFTDNRGTQTAPLCYSLANALKLQHNIAAHGFAAKLILCSQAQQDSSAVQPQSLPIDR